MTAPPVATIEPPVALTAPPVATTEPPVMPTVLVPPLTVVVAPLPPVAPASFAELPEQAVKNSNSKPERRPSDRVYIRCHPCLCKGQVAKLSFNAFH